MRHKRLIIWITIALMLGNSLTAANHMPVMLAKLLDAEVTVHARGGARLAEQLNPDTKLGARTDQVLRERHFDYVVLQEMSHGPATAREMHFSRRNATNNGRNR